MGETKDEGKTKVANTFCYFGYTYTLPRNQHSNPKLSGIGPVFDGKDSEKRYHSYYRWVPLMLFIQVTRYLYSHFYN